MSKQPKQFTYFKDDSDKAFNVSSMTKYVDKKQEIDVFLEKLIAPVIKGKKLKVLDACCGIGHVSNFLSDLSLQSTFHGVDQTAYLIEEAKKLFKEKKNLSFETLDAYDLPAKYGKEFDVSISWKTISWLPYYEDMLKALVAVTKKHIFISSLFYDGDIDFEIKVREYTKEAGKKDFNAFYNVYSLPRFKKFVTSLGAKDIQVNDFEIGIDLPRGSVDHMHTYTVKTESGSRLQISGAVLMSWKIIRIDL